MIRSAQVEGQPTRSRLALALASLRAPQWLHFCVLPLAALDREALLALPHAWPRALAGCLAASGCLAFAYGINAVAERRSDRSSGKNPLVDAPELAPLATALSVLAALLALALALWQLGMMAGLACLVSILCGTTYSVGIGGKKVPVLGLLLNLGIFVPLGALLLDPAAIPASWRHELAVFALLLIQNQLVHELADYDEDRAAKAHTTARFLRRRKTVRVATAIGLLVPLAAILLAPTHAEALLASLLAGVTTMLTAESRRDPARTRREHRRVAFVGGALLWLLARLG